MMDELLDFVQINRANNCECMCVLGVCTYVFVCACMSVLCVSHHLL